MRVLSTMMILLALPVYGLTLKFAPYATVILILGAFLVEFIYAETHRRE